MEIKTLKFKTNINCDGCITKVTPFISEIKGISDWSVDIKNKDKILSVNSNTITQQEVIEKLQQAGFKIEILTK